MSDSEIAIFVPTMYRPQNVEPLVFSLVSNTKHPFNLYYVCPEDDTETILELKRLHIPHWTDSGDMRYTKRMQFLYENTEEDFFFTGSDDIIFQEGWLESAFPFLLTHFVIGFQDLCNPLADGTNFLINRRYIQEFSGVIDSPNTVFNQYYYHNFCDTELVGTAKSRNAFVKCSGIVEHMHPNVGKAPRDKVYDLGFQHFYEDENLYRSRMHLWSN